MHLGNLIMHPKFDQYFLKDKSILEKEIELAELKRKDVVLEIGPGTGNLTALLSEKCKVIAIELDKSFQYNLSNLEIIYGDAVPLIKDQEFNKIVSNIPYSRSQDIIIEILKKKWEIAVLTVQKEFAYKLLKGSALSVIVNDCCFYEIDSIVPASSFEPEAVDSAIIVMEQKHILDEPFWKFVKKLYTKKNKNAPSGKKIHQLSIEELKDLYISIKKTQ